MSNPKKYQKLYSGIYDEIENGQYKGGDKLPSENLLAERYGISRQTVRQALKRLENEGVICKVHGSGSYVSEIALPSKKTKRIAVITTYISSYIFPSILRGIDEIVNSQSYTLTLMVTNNSIAKEREILQKLSADMVDGILVEGTKTALPNPNLSFYEKLSSRHIPLVFFNAYYPDLFKKPQDSMVYVVTDDYRGGYDLTTELIKAGHRNIGGIFKSDDIQGMNRFSGYIAALSDNNVAFCDDHILWFTTESKSIIERMLHVAEKILSECSAIVCYNDEIGSQVLEAMKDGEHSITAVSSFDKAYPLSMKDVEVHSLEHPKENLGRMAANKLFDIMRGNHEENEVLPWK